MSRIRRAGTSGRLCFRPARFGRGDGVKPSSNLVHVERADFRDDVVEPRSRHRSGERAEQHTVAQHHHRRDSADLEGCGQPWLRLGVDLAEDHIGMPPGCGVEYGPRCVGDDFEPKVFHVFGAVAIAAIGKLPDTLMDRSVVIE